MFKIMRVSFSRELELSLKFKAIINIMELFQEMKRSHFACSKKKKIKSTCYFPDCPKDIQFLWVYGFNCIVRVPRK